MTARHATVLLLLLSTSMPGFAGELPHGVKPVSRNIFRGTRPGSVSKLQALKNLGIKTIINLQGEATDLIPGESEGALERAEAAAKRNGFNYHNIPVTLSRLDKEDGKEMIRLAALMDDPQQQPVYIHCNAGADRTGFVVATYRILYQGCSFQSARREMLRNGLIWTGLLMAPHLHFLKELKAAQPSITGTPRQRCPLE